jgi:hypothetical protein
VFDFIDMNLHAHIMSLHTFVGQRNVTGVLSRAKLETIDRECPVQINRMFESKFFFFLL